MCSSYGSDPVRLVLDAYQTVDVACGGLDEPKDVWPAGSEGKLTTDGTAAVCAKVVPWEAIPCRTPL